MLLSFQRPPHPQVRLRTATGSQGRTVDHSTALAARAMPAPAAAREHRGSREAARPGPCAGSVRPEEPLAPCLVVRGVAGVRGGREGFAMRTDPPQTTDQPRPQLSSAQPRQACPADSGEAPGRCLIRERLSRAKLPAVSFSRSGRRPCAQAGRRGAMSAGKLEGLVHACEPSRPVGPELAPRSSDGREGSQGVNVGLLG